jgi:hypothetical protein
MLLQVKRCGYLKDLAVADSSYAVIDLLAALQGKVTFYYRLRLDAALYEPHPAQNKGQKDVPPRKEAPTYP